MAKRHIIRVEVARRGQAGGRLGQTGRHRSVLGELQGTTIAVAAVEVLQNGAPEGPPSP